MSAQKYQALHKRGEEGVHELGSKKFKLSMNRLFKDPDDLIYFEKLV